MRTCGHVGSESDDDEYNYRNKDLLKWKNKDTFNRLRSQLIKNGQYKQIKKIEKFNENKIDIFLDLLNINDIDTKNKLCLVLEIYLKKNLDESLNIYLETVVDKNKLRRLKL